MKNKTEKYGDIGEKNRTIKRKAIKGRKGRRKKKKKKKIPANNLFNKSFLSNTL